MSWQAWLIRRRLWHAYRRRPSENVSQAHYIAGVRATLDSLNSDLPRLPRGTELVPIIDGNVRGAWMTARGVVPERTLYYLHGGGYVWGSPKTHADLAMRLSRQMNARIFLVDYRLAPAHRCPAAIEDATAGWRWLLSQDGVDPARTVIAGDSAGGGLSLATLLALRDAGDPLPAAACLLSPWTDMTGTAPSLDANDATDPVLSAFGIRKTGPAYYGDLPADDPRASPLFADLTGLPPMLVQVGSQEILLDDSVRLAARVKEASGSAQLDIWPKMPHVWQMMAFLMPEGRKAIADMADFVKGHTS